MGERMVGEAEVVGREGLAWLLGVASLRREALSRAAQVLAWVQAVETQRGEARDEAAAAEQRCDELEQEVAKLRTGERYWREVAEETRQTAAKDGAEMVDLRREVATLRDREAYWMETAGRVKLQLQERERQLEQLRGGGEE